jgi:acyl transferase domain-containing protein
MSHSAPNSISIVGLSFRVPGATDLDQLWALLSGDREVVGAPPMARYHADSAVFERMRATERPAAFWGAFLEDVETFDARHFEVSPVEARRMDPQQRISLEESWRALEDAGFDPKALGGSRTGVFVGSSNHDYSMSWTYDLEKADLFKVMGGGLGMISNRISHFLDLRGPSFTLDTACSSGLVSIHNAINSLSSKETDLALCGELMMLTPPHLTVAFSRAHMLSNTGRCRAFSDDADGYVRGEAVVFMVLMRTEDALKEGRPIYAQLAGSAVNQDGRTVTITSPNGDAQVAVMQDALKKAGLSPDHLSYLEAHGTGTPVGDPIEYQSMARLLRSGSTTREQPCHVGSAKAYLGHAEPASGMVGILKTIASLQHEMIPKHRHFRALTSKVTADAVIAIPTQAVAWPRGEQPRVAGISSFGFGGTNAHLILRETPGAFRAPGKLRRFEGKRHWKKAESPEVTSTDR